MGKPATTYFCEKGHMVEHNPPGVYGELDVLKQDEEYDLAYFDNEVAGGGTLWPPCRICGSPIIKNPVSDWLNNKDCTSSVVRIGCDIMHRIIPGHGPMDCTVGVFDVSSII